jgi:hypothetical protein
VEVQARGGLVEDVEGAAGGALGELLDSVTRCASPPESVVSLLADMDVAEPDLLQRRECFAPRARLEESRLVTVMSSTSAIDFPLNCTSSVSRL